MNKAHKQTRKEIRKYIKKWEFLVTHFGWKFDVIFCKNNNDMPSGDCVAIVYPVFKYLKAKIYFDLDECATVDIEAVVLHEIAHILISPVDKNDPDEESIEYLTTTVSRCFIGINNGKTI